MRDSHAHAHAHSHAHGHHHHHHHGCPDGGHPLDDDGQHDHEVVRLPVVTSGQRVDLPPHGISQDDVPAVDALVEVVSSGLLAAAAENGACACLGVPDPQPSPLEASVRLLL